MMTKLLNALLWVLGLLFVILGLRWLIDPQAAAATLGMALSDGVGRSSQIGDFGAFFFTGGLWVLLGAWRKAPIFLYVSATGGAVQIACVGGAGRCADGRYDCSYFIGGRKTI
jgi:hypothetical protein